MDSKGFLKIEPAELTVTVKDKTSQYTGAQQYGYDIPLRFTEDKETSEYKVAGLKGEDVLEIEDGGYVKAYGTNVGTYDGDFQDRSIYVKRGTTDVARNYTITATPGKLTITGKTLEIHVKGVEKTVTYSGAQQTLGTTLQYTVLTKLPEGLTVEQEERVEQKAKGTDVGTYVQETLTANHLYLSG